MTITHPDLSILDTSNTPKTGVMVRGCEYLVDPCDVLDRAEILFKTINGRFEEGIRP